MTKSKNKIGMFFYYVNAYIGGWIFRELMNVEFRWPGQRRFSRSDWCLYLSCLPNNRSYSKKSSGRSQASRPSDSLPLSKEPRFLLSSFSSVLLRTPKRGRCRVRVYGPTRLQEGWQSRRLLYPSGLSRRLAFFLWWHARRVEEESQRNAGIRWSIFPFRRILTLSL